MKILIIIIALFFTINGFAQKSNKNVDNSTNLIVITLDGLRWQDLFNGVDTSIANNKKFNEGDSLGIYNTFYKKPLMPFITNIMVENGQVWGNRNVNCLGTVANPYWFSYPGYSELWCGFVDTNINSNKYKPNPNYTLLEFLQKQKSYKNKIVAFGAWDAFDRILNEKRANFPIFNAYDKYINKKSKYADLLNKLNNESVKTWGEEECLDVFTHHMAYDYLTTQLPKVMYIAYGETDEWAHSGKYKSYLTAAQQTNQWIAEIWQFVQTHQQYKQNTILLITTDHGRGLGNEWTGHDKSVPHSNETWFAIMGKGVTPNGFIKNKVYQQKQLAQTLANLLGLQYTAQHQVSEGINLQ
jgi:hypothetical protein